MPPSLFPKNPAEQAEGFSLRKTDMVRRWVERHLADAERLFYEAKYPEKQIVILVSAMKAVAGRPPLNMRGGRVASLRNLPLEPNGEHALFVRIDCPRGTKVGASFTFHVHEQDSRTHRLIGGSRYQVVVNRPA